MSPTNKILTAGFSAIVATMICCTYIVNKTIKQNGFYDSHIIRAIESEGKLTRDAIRNQPEQDRPFSSPW